jgi:hypothetical protein
MMSLVRWLTTESRCPGVGQGIALQIDGVGQPEDVVVDVAKIERCLGIQVGQLLAAVGQVIEDLPVRQHDSAQGRQAPAQFRMRCRCAGWGARRSSSNSSISSAASSTTGK